VITVSRDIKLPTQWGSYCVEFYSTLVHTPSEVADSRQDTWTTVFFFVSFLKLHGVESLRS
jgi:hypothetical protein